MAGGFTSSIFSVLDSRALEGFGERLGGEAPGMVAVEGGEGSADTPEVEAFTAKALGNLEQIHRFKTIGTV